MFESLQLVDEAFIRVSLFTLGFDELKDVIELRGEEFHDEHDGAGGGARHTHGAVDKHSVFVVWVACVDGVDRPLEPHVLLILLILGLTPCFLLFPVYLQHLIGDREVTKVAARERLLPLCLDGAIRVWYDGILDELVDGLEGAIDLLLLGVMEAKMQVP